MTSTTLSERANARAEERRWWILAVLCFSLLVIVLDNTILNVAIPTIVRDLDATNSQLQWMVDAYTLVFAGLLLTGGSLGDRFGRRGALQVGLVVFGLGSLASAFATTSEQLIATRAFMGIGGAFIMPATLSIITNVFPARERGKAIGVWAATAGLAGVLGPLTGGFLLEHFYWGSIFLVNIPIVVIGLLAGVFLIPTSKDPAAPKLDPVGAVLSIIGLSVLLYAIIEAPQDGWTDSTILSCFVGGVAVLGLFLLWESRSDHPMLDVSFFQKARFTAASLGIMMVFFAMFGATFLLTQYFQFVLGYTPFETGVRFLPIALCMMVLSPLSARFVHRIGTKLVVTGGLLMVTAGLVSWASLSASSSYWPDIVWRQALMASGMALTMAPATESIMGSLPLGKAGVGSAVNDTTRQVGGALGVAVIGSVLASIYGSRVGDFLHGKPVPSGTAADLKQSLGLALAASKQVPGLGTTAVDAFIDGMHAGVIVAAGVALVGAFVALIWLPARASYDALSEPAADAGAAEPTVAGITDPAVATT
jgi:EmrB/QacA subfamily drug resistance transporter